MELSRLRKERPEQLAREIIRAHKEGHISLDRIGHLVEELPKKAKGDPLAYATAVLLSKYLKHYLFSQIHGPEDAKLSHVIAQALEQGKDPIEHALQHLTPEKVHRSFVGVNPGHRSPRHLLSKAVLDALKHYPYLKSKLDISASDIVHLYYFMHSHGLPKEVVVTIAKRGKRGEVDIRQDYIDPLHYLKTLLGRQAPSRLPDFFTFLLNIRDAYKESGEKVSRVISEGQPDFAEIDGKLIPLSAEFYELNIPLDYIFRANPKIALSFLSLSPSTIKQRIRRLERRTGKPIKELVRIYTPDTLFIKKLKKVKSY